MNREFKPGDRVTVSRARPWDGPFGVGVVDEVQAATSFRSIVVVKLDGRSERVKVFVNAIGTAVDRPSIDIELLSAAEGAT